MTTLPARTQRACAIERLEAAGSVRLRDVVAEGNRPEITARLAMASQSARPAVCTRPRTRRLTPGTCSQSTVRGGSRRPTTRASSRQCHWQSASSTLAWSS